MVKRKDGRWQQELTVTEHGRKRQRFFYGRTKAEVLRKIADYKEQSEHGRPFDAVVSEWWEQHEPRLAYSTRPGYERGKNRAVEHFGQTPIREIAPFHVSQFMSAMVTRYDMAKKTAMNQKTVLDSIFSYAVQSGDVLYNPCVGISVPRDLKHEKRQMASSQDIQRIKDSVGCTFGLFAYMAMYTGMRKGELLALTWTDIDLTNRIIHVTKSLYTEHNKPMIKPPKTETGVRDIPILDKLYSVLVKQKRSKGPVFSKDGRYLTGKEYTVLYNMYRSESGVSCTAHQLRHTYATMLFEANVAVKDAQRMLGHAQASTTQDVYTEMRKQRESVINESIRNIDIS